MYLYCARKTNQPTQINIGGDKFEKVNSFKYLGTMVNNDKSIEEEVKERIAAGNRHYHAHKTLSTSKLVYRKVNSVTLSFVLQ
jgi:hypothetical protein